MHASTEDSESGNGLPLGDRGHKQFDSTGPFQYITGIVEFIIIISIGFSTQWFL